MDILKKLAKSMYEISGDINLFSKQDRELLETKHFPDALEVLKIWEIKKDEKVLDLGTGGGIPGLVLAAAHPELEISLCDARAKKLSAIKTIAEELGFEKISYLYGRFEELGHSEYREKFDLSLARAVAQLPVLLEYASAFLKPGGRLIAWKSADFQTELESSIYAQETLHLVFEKAHLYELQNGEGRALLVFRKQAALNEKYPRRDGLPKIKPLK